MVGSQGLSNFGYLILWVVIIYILIEWYPPLGWSLAAVAGALMLSQYKGF